MFARPNIDGAVAPDRAWISGEQIDKTPACAAHKASQSSPRRLRKVAGNRDMNATALLCDESDKSTQRGSRSVDRNRNTSPEATADQLDVMKNTNDQKRWFSTRKKKSINSDSTTYRSGSDSPKSSTDYDIPAEDEQPLDAKKSCSHHRNKLRKLPPSRTLQHGITHGAKTTNDLLDRRRGDDIKSKTAGHIPMPLKSRNARQCPDEGFHVIASRGGDLRGSLSRIVISEAVIFNLSDERDSRARDLAQKWLEARTSRPATDGEDLNDVVQEANDTGREEMMSTGRDAESPQLEAETRCTDRKAYRLSLFQECLGDSDGESDDDEDDGNIDDDDIDPEDYNMLNVTSVSNITDQMSRFLGLASTHEQLAALASDDLDEEETRCRIPRHEKDFTYRRPRSDDRLAQIRGKILNTVDTSMLPVRDRPSHRQLEQVAYSQHPRLLSPITEQLTPSPEPATSSPDQMSPFPDLASSSPEREPFSPAVSDSGSCSDYVSCRSRSWTCSNITERSITAEEVEIGVASTRPLIRVVESELRSVVIAQPKGEERQNRVDTPMVEQNGLPETPPLEEHVPWWEQVPTEPRVVPKFACGPSVVVAPSTPSRAKSERPRAPTPEAKVLLRRMHEVSKTARPRVDRGSQGKLTLPFGRPAIAADLEYNSKHDNEVVRARPRKMSVSERGVGMHLPVAEPVDIPRAELRRMFTEM
ncbi:hypothetical protein DOTSEDRAFT_53994 [Dothistroma septosporum NZE10]|uniref:Uncharacterized protein n=1 Tax=Dothistroma septosporum (strain NZE10 / CBS 128990) TaxID=675120 RepID=M2Y459_DOTSN|nr:hypothetical protein DOTSEDRAFT_53994 [Dothistroma septosporum NZE10]